MSGTEWGDTRAHVPAASRGPVKVPKQIYSTTDDGKGEGHWNGQEEGEREDCIDDKRMFYPEVRDGSMIWCRVKRVHGLHTL